MNDARELARLMKVLTTRRTLLRGAALGGAGLAAAALIGCGDDDDEEPAATPGAAGRDYGGRRADGDCDGDPGRGRRGDRGGARGAGLRRAGTRRRRAVPVRLRRARGGAEVRRDTAYLPPLSRDASDV